MSVEPRPESKTFIVMAVLAAVLSTAATAFAALHGSSQDKPRLATPSADSAWRANHKRHGGHPSLWLIHATDWIVSVADRAFG